MVICFLFSVILHNENVENIVTQVPLALGSLAEGDLEWADSVTVKPKTELLQNIKENITEV